jgi:hypothetical protein
MHCATEKLPPRIRAGPASHPTASGSRIPPTKSRNSASIEIESTQGRPYDITRDSKQFLVMQRPQETATVEKTAPQIQVVLNWFEELKQRVPTH